MFQFQCGAIGSRGVGIVQCCEKRFNSSVVRLVGAYFVEIIRQAVFQFQCGAIGSRN